MLVKVVSGGVASNQILRQRLNNLGKHYGMEVYFPLPKYCTDNGVMIAWSVTISSLSTTHITLGQVWSILNPNGHWFMMQKWYRVYDMRMSELVHVVKLLSKAFLVGPLAKIYQTRSLLQGLKLAAKFASNFSLLSIEINFQLVTWCIEVLVKVCPVHGLHHRTKCLLSRTEWIVLWK